MKMEKVESAAIAEMGYDEATMTLAVRYKHGGLYHYHDVLPSAFKKLKEADSLGAHFHKHIRSQHAHTKI